MKISVFIVGLYSLLLSTSCVQKSYNRTVVVTLDVSEVKNIQSVGIRGNGAPLSWESDFPMKAIVKDSLYQAVISAKTGYLFAEIKCTVNGNFELPDEANRSIVFDLQKDTTNVHLVFNKR